MTRATAMRVDAAVTELNAIYIQYHEDRDRLLCRQPAPRGFIDASVSKARQVAQDRDKAVKALLRRLVG